MDTSLRSRSQHYSAKGEQVVFAAKIRLARAVLGGLTQRAIHKLEQGETEPRRKTADAFEEIWGHKKSNSVTGGMAAFK